MVKTSNNGTAEPSSAANLKKQVFAATEGQSVFPVTSFGLTDAFLVTVGELPQETATRTGQNVTLLAGVPAGTSVVIRN